MKPDVVVEPEEDTKTHSDELTEVTGHVTAAFEQAKASSLRTEATSLLSFTTAPLPFSQLLSYDPPCGETAPIGARWITSRIIGIGKLHTYRNRKTAHLKYNIATFGYLSELIIIKKNKRLQQMKRGEKK